MIGRIKFAWPILAGVVCAGWLGAGGTVRADEPPVENDRRGRPGVASRSDSVNFSDLATESAAAAAPVRINSRPESTRAPRPRPSVAPSARVGLAAQSSQTPVETVTDGGFSAASLPPSPPASASFEGLADDGTRFNPDTHGAVGP